MVSREVPRSLRLITHVFVLTGMAIWLAWLVGVVLPLHLLSAGGRLRTVARLRNALFGLVSAVMYFVAYALVLMRPIQLVCGYELWVMFICGENTGL